MELSIPQKLIRARKEGPLYFATQILKVEPSPNQQSALEAINENDHVAIRAAHDQGKTALLAWVAWWFFWTRFPLKIVVAANTQDQLRDVTWAELAKWGRRLPPELLERVEIGAERIFMRGAAEESFMVARTASKSNPEALQGFHSENLMFLLEEASGMEDIIFEIASGAMSSKGAKALMIGNPNRASGYFARAFKENRWLWKGLHFPWVLNPWSDPGYPEQMAREYGETSNVYRIRVLGEFPTSEDNSVVPLELIEAAIARDIDLTLRRSTVWGIDIARFGDDRSALVKRKGNHILEKAKTWRQRDLMQSSGIVAKEYFETPEGHRPTAINCDVIGIGAGVVDRLRELGLPVFGVNVGEVPEDNERFARKRDELMWKVREWLQRRDVKMIDDPDLVSDLVGPTYKILSTGKVQVESKDDMKKRGVRSPDIADALALTFAGGEFAGLIRNRAQAINEYDPLDFDAQYRRGGQQEYAINE